MITRGQGPQAGLVLEEHRRKGSFCPGFKCLIDADIRGGTSTCRGECGSVTCCM